MSEIRNVIMQMAQQDPRFQQGVSQMEKQVERMPIVPEDLDDAIAMLEFVLQNPDKYEEVRASAIKDGLIQENMVPPQYDVVFIVSLLIALYGLQDHLNQKGYAGGGLVTAARRLQAAGRGGDDMLAHINHREAEMLKRMGGAGTINPTTGLHEYKSIFKIFTSIILPAALMFIPGIGTAVGSTLFGLTGTAAAMAGGATLGAGLGAINGGWKGALMGGVGGALSGGLGGSLGSSANSALGLGLGKAGQAALGSGLIGAGVGAANAGISGGNVLKGALVGGATGAAGGAIANAASGIGTDSAIGLGLNRAGQGFGNALTAGFKPKQAAISGGLAGLAAGLQFQTPEQLASQHSADSQGKLNDINAGNKNFSLDMGKQVNVSDIGIKPSDMAINSLQNGSNGLQINDTASLGLANSSPSLGGGQYVTDPSTGAENWVPNQPNSGLLGLAQNTYASSAPSGGYGSFTDNQVPQAPGQVGTPTFAGNQTNTAVTAPFTQYGFDNLSPSNVLGSNTLIPESYAQISGNQGNGVNTLGGSTGPTNYTNNANGVYNQGTSPDQVATDQAKKEGFDWGKAALIGGGALALGTLGKSMFSDAPAAVQNSVGQLSKQQQEYFNRPNVAWDWDKMQQNATARNMSLPEFMAQSWPTIASGQYNVALKAMGGPLARFARGAGSGRDDTIDAKLSDGEYVIDAETVALLGDGSNKAGAQMLDKMRREIRAQKGKALARGKISPNAKSPLAYLRGAM